MEEYGYGTVQVDYQTEELYIITIVPTEYQEELEDYFYLTQ